MLTIVSYDGGNAPTPKEYADVTGTLGNKMAIINGAIAFGDKTSETWMQEVSSVSVSKILHTFTIEGLGINIPIEAGTTSVVVIPSHNQDGNLRLAMHGGLRVWRFGLGLCDGEGRLDEGFGGRRRGVKSDVGQSQARLPLVKSALMMDV